MSARVRVYQNLRRAVWSIQDPRTGLLVEHRASLVLVDVTFTVSEATRQRVIRRQRRTVHAYAVGTVVDEPVREGGRRLRYNPFVAGSFLVDGEPVSRADRVDFRPDGAFVGAT